jgi:hypothetical protein
MLLFIRYASAIMNDETFILAEKEAKEKLRTAILKLNACYREQNELGKEITDLRAVVVSLSRMRDVEFVEEDEFGMTDSIRLVLAAKGVSMNADDVRAGLYEIGFDTNQYQNAMAAIQTSLKRLADKGEAAMATVNQKPTYRWAGNNVQLKSLTHDLEPGTSISKK